MKAQHSHTRGVDWDRLIGYIALTPPGGVPDDLAELISYAVGVGIKTVLIVLPIIDGSEGLLASIINLFLVANPELKIWILVNCASNPGARKDFVR